MKKGFIGLVFLWVTQICCAQFSLRSDQPIKLACDNAEEKVVQTALKLFIRDYQSVFSASAAVDARQGNIIVGTVGKSPLLKAVSADVSALIGKKQAFLLQVLPDGKLLVAGSDSHGTAYGIMELSRLIGVSPWEWWADVTPEKKISFVLPAEYQTLQSPSVEYRGIFINDEDWGLMPWSSQTYEPSDVKGHIGPKTNARIFELLLRLRANTYWPAMHECTLPFFLTEGNRKVAEEYGIFIGSSHCEPMVCSAAGEWRRRGQGDYDYVNNSASVYKFWEDRVKEVAQQGNIYTLGMRGVHDGQMQGAKTVAEQKAVLERVLKDQRGLLQKYNLFASIRDFSQCSANTGSFHCQFQQVAFLGFHAFGDSLQCFLHFSFITSFFQTLQVLNLFQTNCCIVDFKDINRSFFLQAILVHTNDSLRTGVDTGLRTCSCFFDTHLRNTGFDSFRHTTQFFNFLNEFPSLVSQLVCQRLYIVRTTPRVNILADISFFLNINLSVTCDTCREVRRQRNSLVKCIGVQRLSMSQCSSHGLDTSTANIVKRILLGQ